MSSARLENVQSMFSQWRQQRRHIREAIPSSLWEAACSLYPEYSRGSIQRLLNLPPVTYQREFAARTSREISPSPPLAFHSLESFDSMEFLSLGSPPLPNSQSEVCSELQLKPDGSVCLQLRCEESLKELFFKISRRSRVID